MNMISNMQDFEDLNDQLKIYSHNIEGISKPKCQVLAKIAFENEANVILLQETHTKSDSDILSRGIIEGYSLVAALHSPVHGIATYIQNNIDEYDIIFNDKYGDVFVSAININGTTIINIYKPPSSVWPDNVLPVFEDPCVYSGDLNCHHTQWGYRFNDNDGELLLDWANNNSFELIFDAKDKKSFFSKVHHTETNPDLCFVSRCLLRNDGVKRFVLDDFPRSQHRPIFIKIGLSIHLVNSYPKPRWNFSKAKWNEFSNEMDYIINKIPPKVKNYGRFIKLVSKIGKKHIPRGFRDRSLVGTRTVINCTMILRKIKAQIKLTFFLLR